MKSLESLQKVQDISIYLSLVERQERGKLKDLLAEIDEKLLILEDQPKSDLRENKELQNEIESLNIRNAELLDELEKLSNNNDYLQHSIKELQVQNDLLSDSFKNSELLLKSMRLEFEEKLKSERKMLEGKICSLENDLCTVKEEYKNKEEKFESERLVLESKIESMDQILWDSKIEEVRKSMESLSCKKDEEFLALEKKLSDREQNIESLLEETTAFKRNIRILKEANEDAEEVKRKLASDLEHVQ